MGERRAKLAAREQAHAEHAVRHGSQGGVAASLGQLQGLQREAVRGVGFAARQVVGELSVEHREKPLAVADPLAQLAGAVVAGPRLGRRPSLVGHQRLGQEKLQAELAAVALQAVRQALEHAQSLGQLGDRLAIGAALDRLLAGLAPVAHRAPGIAGLRPMLGQLLRRRLRERRFEGRRDARVQRLARRAQQALIGDALHQRVLEAERRVRPGCFLEHQPGGDELVEQGVQLRFVRGRRRRRAGHRRSGGRSPRRPAPAPWPGPADRAGS